jgi:hypothetical protein
VVPETAAMAFHVCCAAGGSSASAFSHVSWAFLIMVQKARNYRQAYWWPRCGAYARSTNAPCRRKVERDEAGRPKARCWNHGSAPGSGKQTEQGRRNIAEATRMRMKRFWADWKAEGSPAISRGYVQVGQSKPAPRATARPARAQKTKKQGGRLTDAKWLRAIGVVKRPD